jgi:hypothetical protein
MDTPRFALVAVSVGTLLAPGCKDGANKANPAPGTPPAPATAPLVADPGAAVAKDAPPTGLVFLAPPLGAPDKIAPTTLELIPGMREADAIAKGAKSAGSTGHDWDWRPDMDLQFDPDHGVIKGLVGKYTPAQIEELKKAWGKPTFGEDYWMGANWLAEIGTNCGSEPPCFVYFSRAPNAQFFGKTPVPPIGLATLKYGMSEAEVSKLFGVELSPFIDSGYEYNVTFDFGGDKLHSIRLAASPFEDDEHEVAYLTSLWGKPAKIGDDAVAWVDTAARWAAVHDIGLYYYPIAPWAELLAKDGPYSIVATSTKLLGMKADDPAAKTRGWPGIEAAPNEQIKVEPSADRDVVDSVSFMISMPTAAVATHVASVEKTFGKAKAVKDEYDDVHQVITTADGLAIEVVAEDWGLTLTVRKPAA